MATDVHVFMRESIIRFLLRSADDYAAVNPRCVVFKSINRCSAYIDGRATHIVQDVAHR